MFLDAVWAHLGMFVVGQVFAWRYARSGRFWLGAGATALLWLALDAWLVSRYVLALAVNVQVGALALLYAVVFVTAASFLWAAVRRLRGRRTRTARHREAMACLMRGDAAAAIAAYRGLVWSDGWDAPAWVGLGDAERRCGQPRRAARSYRRARSVDVGAQLRDLIAHREQLLASIRDLSGSVVGRVAGPSGASSRPRRTAASAS